MSIYIRAQDIEALKRNMRGYLDEVATKKERQKILLAGGRVVRAKVKRGGYFKDSKKPRTYYSKQGKITIMPGNLRTSMYAFKTKVGSVEVGPRVLKKIAGKYDKIGETPKTSSGYYAAMLFKKAANFRRQVTEAAMAASISKIDAAMQRTFQRIHRTWKKKYNL
jgi:hypothetical protein